VEHGELVRRDSPLPYGTLEPWKPPTSGPTGFADLPLDNRQLETLDEVIRSAERVTGLRFSAFLGDLGVDSRARALELLGGLGPDAPNAVLVALSPGQRIVEVVTGTVAALRITDRACRLAVLNMVSSATNGDVMGALVNGLRTLADQAGTLPDRTSW
jgi:hypothetical protein